jgi:hypothetical protein
MFSWVKSISEHTILQINFLVKEWSNLALKFAYLHSTINIYSFPGSIQSRNKQPIVLNTGTCNPCSQESDIACPQKKNRVMSLTLSKAVSRLSCIHLKAIPRLRLRLRLLRTVHNNTLKVTVLSVSAKTQTNMTRIECSTNVGSVRPLLSSWTAVTNCHDSSLTSSDPGSGFR